MKFERRTVWAGLGTAGLLSVAAVGCVPRDTGYRAVQDLAEARWRGEKRPASANDQDKTVQQLLARPLTADSAAQIAVLNNRRVLAAFEEVGIARAGLVHALRLPNPVAEGAVRFKGDSPELDLGASLDLTELLFLPWRKGVADAQLEAAKVSVVGFIVDLAFDARIAFYDYVATTQTLELLSSVLDALRASSGAAASLHEAGNITDLEFANERALYEEAQLALTRAETSVTAAREQLNALLGLERDAGWKTVSKPRLPEPPKTELATESIESRALARSIDLALARQRSSAADQRASLARGEGWFPELKAGVSAEREEGEWGIGPAVELEVPLFYQGQGEVGAALAEMRRQQHVQADLAVHIQASARAAAAQLRAARKSVVQYQEVVLPLRKSIVEGTQLEYNAMGVGVFQLLQAKRDQIESGRVYVELLRDYWMARTEAERLIAGRLSRGALSTEQLIRESTPLTRGRGGLEQH